MSDNDAFRGLDEGQVEVESGPQGYSDYLKSKMPGVRDYSMVKRKLKGGLSSAYDYG